MTTLREQTGTFEIILAALGAAGLVMMMISPVSGRVIVLISLILAALCYVRCSLMVINFAEEDRFYAAEAHSQYARIGRRGGPSVCPRLEAPR